MTGIEMLRNLAQNCLDGSVNGYTTMVSSVHAAAIDAIADQIEREQGERVSRMRVLAVATEMERHVSGVEGAEDSPVARWASELREALGGDGRDPAADTTVDAYDMLPQEDREAIAWVRAHGGLEAVKRRWECLSYYADPVPRSCMEKRLARRQRQIDECHEALRRRNQRIAEIEERVRVRERANDELNEELNAMRPRLMPEGMEWPKVDGEPVVIGELMRSCGIDDCKVVGIDPESARLILASDDVEKGKATYFPDFANYCHRPAPKVLDADGVEIREGDTVYYVDGREQKVNTVARLTDGLVQFGRINEAGYVTYCEGACISPDKLTHRAPVLAADGKLLREGETVYLTDSQTAFVVDDIMTTERGLAIVHLKGGAWHCPQYLTHERPDSWERLVEDALNFVEDNAGIPHDQEQMERDILDLVRRAKALAGGA